MGNLRPVIRLAKESDASAVYRLWRELTDHELKSWGAQKPYPAKLGDADAMRVWLPQFKAALVNPDTFFLVGEVAGNVEAYLVGYVNKREFGHPQRFMELSEMFVRPAHMKSLVGYRLMRLAERLSKLAGATHMECGALATEQQTRQAMKVGWKPYLTRFYKEVR